MSDNRTSMSRSNGRRTTALRLVVTCCSILCLLSCASDPATPPSTLIEMVTVSGGSFRMGDLSGQNRQPDELPPHQVVVRPFMLSRLEVTQELYVRAIGVNPSHNTGKANNPVENISWFEAVAFCNALSLLEGFVPCYSGIEAKLVVCDFNANGYRLPTEAEWEFACRAGSMTDYHSGNTEQDLAQVGWYADNSGGATHPGGQLRPNDFGLQDVHGNVAEWCWDWYSPTYYASSPSDNPRGPETGESKVMRGGSFFNYPYELRSSFRSSVMKPEQKGRETGLRVARSLS